jgi:hypothetical protein
MAVQAQGYMKLNYNAGTDETPDWKNVPGVTVANGLGFGENRIDTTNFDTPPGTTESLSGPRPNTPLTFTMQEKTDTEDAAAQEAIHTAADNNVSLGWRLIRGTKAQTFKGVPIMNLSAPVNGVVTYSGSITPDAKPTRGTATP